MTLKVGDRVKHKYLSWYGEGKIIAIRENSFYPFLVKLDKGNEETFSEPYLELVEKKGKIKT